VNVVNLRTYSDAALLPVVIVIDPQREYEAEDRALRLPAPEPAIENCRRIVRFARLHGLPLALLRWRQRGKFLADVNGFAGWLDGLAPRGSDMVFERSTPSCYGSNGFAEMMNAGGGEHAVVAGFTGALACLSTVIDGYHRGHKLTFVADASASHRLEGFPTAETDRLVASIIGLYAPVMSTREWMESLSAALKNQGS
jgi:nicotinamidase-related amidase